VAYRLLPLLQLRLQQRLRGLELPSAADAAAAFLPPAFAAAAEQMPGQHLQHVHLHAAVHPQQQGEPAAPVQALVMVPMLLLTLPAVPAEAALAAAASAAPAPAPLLPALDPAIQEAS
jgi:hypothetical protein